MPGTNGNNSRRISLGAQGGRQTDQAVATDGDLSRGRPDMDLRLAKIALLQRAIANGTYRVPSGAVAEKVITRLLDPVKAAPPDVRPARREPRDAW